MGQSDLPDKGFDRRGFLSGSGLLLTGALLGAAKETEAREEPPSPVIPPPDSPQDKAGLIGDLVAANHILAYYDIVDGYGHVSVRNPDDPNHFFISRWLAPELVTRDDVVELDLDCVPVAGDKRKLYSERWIHSEIYRVRPDVKAIVHTHAPTIVLMSVCGEAPVPLYHMAGFIGTGVPLFDIRQGFGMTNMLVSDANRGKALAQTLGNSKAALMRGHGGITVGLNLSQAVGRSVYLKINSELQVRVLGRKITSLAPEEARLAEAGNQDFPKDWDLWKLKVMGKA